MVSVLSTALGLRPQAHFGPTRIFQPVNSIYLYLVSAAGDVTLLAGCLSKVVDTFGSVKTIRLSKSCYFRILQEKRKISLQCFLPRGNVLFLSYLKLKLTVLFVTRNTF